MLHRREQLVLGAPQLGLVTFFEEALRRLLLFKIVEHLFINIRNVVEEIQLFLAGTGAEV